MNDQGPANRLIQESSLYLRQHAHNPVDWYPWGPEAIDRARQLDRPIFLSVGYSACHWCHVMEHESFEDPEIARVLNDNFVSIKVDREERPDLDQIYMSAVQLLTHQGGWPMSVFLTPELKPFYGGTYFPPDDRYGRPGFKRLLRALADAWRQRRAEVLDNAGQITEHLQQLARVPAGAGQLDAALLRNVVPLWRRAFDRTHGGFGPAPKFPHAVELRLLFRMWQRFGDLEALDMARLTLDRMARGGIYDQLGGGFHRYSTDERWLVPHFEKMLYDNALLSGAYLEAFQATGQPFYRQIVGETLDYVLREMTGPEGAFYSTQDADSEGAEGKFYVWSAGQIEAVLGKELAELFGYVHGVSLAGNWEEHNILCRSKSDEQDARMLRLTTAELRQKLHEARHQLLEVRSQRVWPARDEKILTAWNGLMIASCAEAGQVLQEPRYTQAAVRAADFVLRQLRGRDGRLLRTTSAGSTPKYNAYLEDYAYLINALVSVYEATFEPRWIESALQLAELLVDRFWDTEAAGFYFTGKDHESLISRLKDMHDSSTPSGNSMAVTALLRLGRLAGRSDLLAKAEKTLQAAHGLMEQSPLAAGQMLSALDFYLGPVHEFAIVGHHPGQPDSAAVLKAIFGRFLPNKVVAFNPDQCSEVSEQATRLVPLLRDKRAQGAVTTYICQDFACQAPLVGAEAVEKALARPAKETALTGAGH